MKFYVMTLFPEMVERAMSESIIGRAMKDGLISLETVNIRDFSGDDRHHHVDDYTYGGGAGMLMQAQPICDAYDNICERCAQDGSDGHVRIVYMSPQGRVFNQKIAKELAQEENLVLLCGHYEGVDERALELTGAESLSIGDYVLTGGELAAMVVMDAVSRMVPGVLTNGESGQSESFEGDLLEYPQYTRPEEYRGLRVPEVLLSGHHANIMKWRRQQSILRTLERRPDLMDRVELSRDDRRFLREIEAEKQAESDDMSSKST